MKKILLTTGCVGLLFAGSVAQTLKVQQKPAESQTDMHHEAPANFIRCATPKPDPRWDEEFNAQVEKYREQMATGKAQAVNYTIAVVFHVVHNNEVKGGATSFNLSQAQLNSQVTILNQDYSGTNSDISQCPSVFTSVKAGNTGVTFCLATKDPNGNTLVEPGIDRIDRNTKGWTAPPYAQTYVDATIKPNSIWDPTKYYNIWTCNLSGGLLGYATFPAGTTLTGLSGTGTSTTDGVVLLGSAVGNTGYISMSAYNKGRSGTHETGHWLGLRHIWGDGNCLTDYCNDTPPAEASHFGCISPATPYHVNMCGTGTSPNGEMTMNYMDYTDDACMFMFTANQATRIQTAMATGTYRSPLTNNSLTLCSGGTAVTPVADFTYPTTICAGQATQFTDASSGPPTSWAWSVSPSTGVVITTATSQNPTINFAAAGTYSVSLTATNSQGSGSKTHTVTVTSCTTSACDTLSNINNTDTLTVYLASGGGYFLGTNTYSFTALGEAYAKTQFATNINQVKGGIILFYKNGAKGTKGTSSLTLSMVNSSSGPGTTVLASKAFTINTATATTAVQRVDYAGDPNLQFSSAIIIPYVAMFTTPGALSADFFLTMTTPSVAGDTVAVFSGHANHSTTNTGWVKYNGSWLDLNTGTGGTNYNMGIIPIACPTTGMQDNTYLGHNINLFPNPSNGFFNFAVALDKPTNLNFAVINPIGQVVATRVESNFMNGVITYDLSSLAKGVYFVQITDSENNKVVKKIMIE